ncbi:MAG: DUF1360 domain-containing protein [Actinomycetota bacterium]|nr:DUF1360 domain-containing protein [Actinomycetota bacterium]
MPASERTTKVTLAGIFLGGLGAFSALLQRRDEQVQVAPFDLVMLGLATYRSGRLVAYERVAAPLREPVTETVPDGSGAGEAVVAAGEGWRWTLGELVSCPVCAGTWIAAGLVYGLHLAPRPTRVYLAVMSATGVAQLLSETTEALTWSSRSARKQAAPIRGV